VGVCSYWLVAFVRVRLGRLGRKKAFMYNRIGDVASSLPCSHLLQGGSLTTSTIFSHTHLLGSATATAAVLLLFLRPPAVRPDPPVQLLPDAMEGPTPVSASSTRHMVRAGV